MKPKFAHFPANTQANARTARWPWFWLGFLSKLLRLITSRLFHLTPIPAAQNATPARKPSRAFSFWKLELAVPRHFRRAISQILMQPNVIVEKREFAHGLFKPSFAVDLNLSNRAFEGAEKSFDSTIHPWRVWCASLVLDAQTPHRQREVQRNQCAIVIGTKRFRLAERFNQPIQHGQNRIRTSVRETQRQQSSAAMINHAQQRVGFAGNRNMRPIQGPSLIGFSRLGRLPQCFAQLRNFIM